MPHTMVARRGLTAILLADQRDWILVFQSLDDGNRAVGTAVVNNDDFLRWQRLRHHTSQCLFDVPLTIVQRNDDRNAQSGTTRSSVELGYSRVSTFHGHRLLLASAIYRAVPCDAQVTRFWVARLDARRWQKSH